MQCTCLKCNKTMVEDQFYTYKDGKKTELCKRCLTLHIDNFDSSTYLWLLQKMDVPYVEEEKTAPEIDLSKFVPIDRFEALEKQFNELKESLGG